MDVEIVYSKNESRNSVGINVQQRVLGNSGFVTHEAIARMDGGVFTLTKFLFNKVIHPRSCPGYQHFIGEVGEDYVKQQLLLDGFTGEINITSTVMSRDEYLRLYEPLKPIRSSVFIYKYTLFKITDNIAGILGFEKLNPIGGEVVGGLDSYRLFPFPRPFTIVRPIPAKPVMTEKPQIITEPTRLDKVLQHFIDNSDRYLFAISLTAIAGSAILLGLEGIEAGGIVSRFGYIDDILIASSISGLANSLVANIAEHKVYKRRMRDTIWQTIVDTPKYIALWGLIIAGSEQIKDVLGINDPTNNSNNFLIKSYKSINSFLDPVAKPFALTSLGIQYWEFMRSQKFKGEDKGKKLAVEFADASIFSLATYFHPLLFAFNIVSLGKMIYQAAKNEVDSKFTKK